jgi:hypothetical protein
MTYTSTLASHEIPPVEHWLDQSDASVHALINNTYDKLKTDPSVGKSRKLTMDILGVGATSEREKERLGHLQTWVDGTNVRVSTVSIYLHLLDLIVASNPVGGPRRKARTPTRSYQKGHRNRNHAQEAEEAASA